MVLFEDDVIDEGADALVVEAVVGDVVSVVCDVQSASVKDKIMDAVEDGTEVIIAVRKVLDEIVKDVVFVIVDVVAASVIAVDSASKHDGVYVTV